MLKKLLVTLDINYPKDITELTFPYLKKYADKIGADFLVLNERKFPKYSVLNEKMQLYDASKGYDWTFFCDADLLIHPDLFDLTDYMEKDTALFWSISQNTAKYKPNDYFRRVKRDVAIATTFFVFSDWLRDLSKFDQSETQEQLSSQVVPINAELRYDRIATTNGWGTDELIISKNIAKYGLRIEELPVYFNRIFERDMTGSFFFHDYMIDPWRKSQMLVDVVKQWKV